MGFLKNNSGASKIDRPKIEVPRTRIDYALEILAAIGVFLGLYELLVNYSALPASIPTHFNFKGEVDSWGSKETILILGAGIIVVHVVLTFVSRIPNMYNFPWEITKENAPRQYRLARTFITLLKTEIVWLFAAIVSETVKVALGQSNQMQPSNLYLFLGLITTSVVGYFIVSYRAR
ncbi:MAG: DUF1648 domain-containing protein [bacterium]|nr:DUF1648 domain-containing protein [bacterium]